jgi:prepilin-type N-terminal cleavage/methylation domain-containing protein
MRKGFTLLETMVAVAIMLITIVVVGTMFFTYSRIQRDRDAVAVLHFIAVNLDRYYEMNGSYPTDITAFLTNTNYFDKVPINPYTMLPLDSNSLAVNTTNKTVSIKDNKGNIAYTVSFGSGAYFTTDNSIRPSQYGGGDF